MDEYFMYNGYVLDDDSIQIMLEQADYTGTLG